jgi:hypothetical protein
MFMMIEEIEMLHGRWIVKQIEKPLGADLLCLNRKPSLSVRMKAN